MIQFHNSFLFLQSVITRICLLLLAGVWLMQSCTKDAVFTKDGRLTLTDDTLHFDTVFTAAGSVTQYFLIKNDNRQSVRISSIELMGGSASFFRMNVDGTPGTSISNLELEGNDSMYVFVSVNINPNTDLLPFLIRDSIKIQANGFTLFKQLEAWGQNARYLRNGKITSSQTWNKNLPYVILGGLVIDTNATLTIGPGTRIHLNADAPLIIDGTLLVNGSKADSVVFQGNRLDEPYRDFPGSWPGMYFRGSSKNNQLNYTVIKNAYQGVITEQPSGNSNPKVALTNCVIDNIYDIGIMGINSSIRADNCLVSNCGNNIALIYGGNYQFTHCTVVSLSNTFVTHKNPAVLATNFVKQNNQVFTASLSATFTNSIIWGSEGFVENEIVVQKEGTAATNLSLQQVLFRSKADPAHTTFSNVIRNEDPRFDSVNVAKRFYNFRLKSGSPAINKGIITTLLTDLDGLPRAGLPDLGCYEKQ
jgi:hypothetical protein